MATIVHTDKDFAKLYVFRTQDEHVLYITDFNEGIAEVEATADHTVESLARAISGCFSKKSNFAKAILKAYNCEGNTEFKGFKVDINGKKVTVTEENSDIDDVLELFKQALEDTKEQIAADMFGELMEMVTGIPKEVSSIRCTTEIEFKDKVCEKSWEKWFNSASDTGQQEIVGFGDLLARFTQKAMEDGYSFEVAIEIRQPQSHWL